MFVVHNISVGSLNRVVCWLRKHTHRCPSGLQSKFQTWVLSNNILVSTMEPICDLSVKISAIPLCVPHETIPFQGMNSLRALDQHQQEMTGETDSVVLHCCLK